MFYPDVGVAAVRVLRRLGVEVDFPKRQTCCGQPALNSGFSDEARVVAARMIDVFADSELVVTPSGSCASMVRTQFPHLFEHDAAMLAEARALGDKTFDFTEFLAKKLDVDWSRWPMRYDASVTFHYSCHLRGLGMTTEAVDLLQRIEGVDYRPLEQMDQCCGFGGTFAVKFGDISGAMVREKVKHIAATKADVLMCNDGGCAMNISGACRREGVDIKVRHIAQILDEAMANGNGAGKPPDA